MSETRDEYDEDFDRMREASLKTKQERAKEELSDVIENIEQLKRGLATAKEKVQRPEYGICLETVKSPRDVKFIETLILAFIVISVLLFSVIISQFKQCLTRYVNLFQFI